MTQKWNLQDIRPAEPRKRRVPLRDVELPDQNASEGGVREAREDIPNVVIENGNKKKRSHIILAVVIFVVVVGGAVLLSALLGKTELTIYPEFREPNVSAEFTAYPDKRENSLSYEIMTIEATDESQVKATGQVEVKKQATGKIEIVKTTLGAERLIKNTRFRSPDGLIFRIQESVVVPGAIKNESGASVPGTITADVFADDVGENYNLASNTRFDIPGFEENGFDELYKAIYATNKAAFTGGFNGPQFQIDDDELATARQALQIKLRDHLLSRVDGEQPADFIAFPGAIAITYSQLPAVPYGNDLVTIREQAVLQIPLFRASEFAAFIAKETIATYEGGPIRIDDPTALSFSYTSPTSSASVIANEPSLTFSLTGKPLLIWEYDANTLKSDLAGLPKKALNNAITAYPGIEGALVRITPFWQQKFPKNEDDIIVVEELKETTE
ncbi:MAG: hypothetical protein AAB388_01800 [Patescibacteria group bacterium]